MGCCFSGSEAMGLTYGMMGWASAMTIAVGVIIAAVVIKKRSTPSPKAADIETSLPSAASARDVTLLPAESLAQQHNENTIAQVHNHHQQQSNCPASNC